MKYLAFLLFLFNVGCACSGVIGVAYDSNGIVKHVFKGSPAESVGIELLDEIVNRSELKGEVGSKFTVRFRRGDRVFEKAVTRMCVDDLNYDDYNGLHW